MLISDSKPLNLQQQIHTGWLFLSAYFILVDYDSYCNFIILKLIYIKCEDICILIIRCIEHKKKKKDHLLFKVKSLFQFKMICQSGAKWKSKIFL